MRDVRVILLRLQAVLREDTTLESYGSSRPVVRCHRVGKRDDKIGEFLAIVEAVKYILRHPEAPRIIYSDSITAITWYRNKQTASSRRCEQLQLAEIFLKVMAAKIDDIQVLHWDNREWGETPADFGNK